MTRRATIHDLAQVLTILCADETIADLMNATLSADADERLDDYQADIAEALFDSLTELRPDCVELAQEMESKPRRSFWRWLVGNEAAK